VRSNVTVAYAKDMEQRVPEALLRSG